MGKDARKKFIVRQAIYIIVSYISTIWLYLLACFVFGKQEIHKMILNDNCDILCQTIVALWVITVQIILYKIYFNKNKIK